MGRYYSGDISGKFWFGVQSSDAGERFGAAEAEPDEIEYYADNLETCQEELKRIEETMGNELQRFEDFFAKNNGYNDKMLKEHGLDINLLHEYADWLLGKEIEECIITQGRCYFSVEL